MQALTLAISILCSVLYTLSFDFIPDSYHVVPKSLSIFLLIFFLLFSAQKIKHLPLILCALFMSGLGDIFLTLDGDTYFLLGLSSFLFAHVFYVLTYFKYKRYRSLQNEIATPFLWGMGSILLIFSIGMILLLHAYLPNALKFPVYLYVVVITLMVLTASMLKPFPTMIFFGALSFAISDSLLSVSIFIVPYPGNAYAVWIFYYVAQFLIVNGLILFNRFSELSKNRILN